MPLICGSLVSMQKPRIGTSVVLYVLLAFFYFIKEESFLNTLFLALFEENVSEAIKNFISAQQEFPQTFFFEWNTQKDSNKKSFFELIKLNFSESFLQSMVYMSNSPFGEIRSIVAFFEKFNEDNFNSSNFSASVVNKSNFMETLKEQVLNNFSREEINEMQSFHRTLSRATGMNVGFIVEDESKQCFIEVFNEFMKKLEVSL